MNKLQFSIFTGMFFALASCNNTDTQQAASGEITDKQAITITPVGQSPEFPEARLLIKQVSTELKGSDSAIVTIQYEVQNYELKNQTSDAQGKGCNNSKDGQHIHFILNNQPYIALYEPIHTFTVALNADNYLTSFLSRSYHESLKNLGAGFVYHFSVASDGEVIEKEVPNQPMVFFSRPKGAYLGEDMENVLLDFYLYNASLSAEGYKVKVTINQNEFVIDKWQSYFIQNALEGDLNIQLELIDKEGNNVLGENTNQTQTARLAIQEPII